MYSNAKLDTKKKPLYGLRWSLLTGGWCSWSGGEPDSEELLLAYETQKNVIQQLQVSLGNNLEQLLTCETQKNVIQQLQVSLSYILEQLLTYETQKNVIQQLQVSLSCSLVDHRKLVVTNAEIVLRF